jgi:DNA-binding response OmpR family regulator
MLSGILHGESLAEALTRSRITIQSESASGVVLIVEDDRAVAKLLETVVNGCGMNPRVAPSAEMASAILSVLSVDVILLDLRLPGSVQGLDFLRNLRAAANDVPVIVVSAVIDVETKVTLFAAGADDYITKPFVVAELEARLRAIVRRKPGGRYLRFFDSRMQLDAATMRVSVEDREMQLTRREFGLFVILAAQRGSPVTITALADEVLGATSPNAEHDCVVHLANIRRKVGENALGLELRTVKGLGYALVYERQQVS